MFEASGRMSSAGAGGRSANEPRGGSAQPALCDGLLNVKNIGTIVFAFLGLSLAACGGKDLTIENPGGGGRTVRLDFPPGQAVEHRLPFRISGGTPPYESSIDGCPTG